MRRASPCREVSDPERMTRDIKKAALYYGASIVGVCKLDRRFVYSRSFSGGANEIPPECEYAVVMGYEEEYDLLKYYPTYIADAAASAGYSRMAITNAYLSEFIRGMGYKAIDCTTNDVALTIPLAMRAGLGDIGRNGLLVSREFGPRLRLSKVIIGLIWADPKGIQGGMFSKKTLALNHGNCINNFI